MPASLVSCRSPRRHDLEHACRSTAGEGLDPRPEMHRPPDPLSRPGPLRRGLRVGRRFLLGQSRRALRFARTERLRQDDDAAHHRRLHRADDRKGRNRGRRRHAPPALRAAHEHRLPELRAVPASARRGKCRLWAEDGGRPAGGAGAAGDGGARARRSFGDGQAPDLRALGRTAAARGAGARAREAAGGPAARRAPRRARSQGAAPDAGGARPHQAIHRHHADPCHARSGGSLCDRRPHRGDEGRDDRPGRHARGIVPGTSKQLRGQFHRRRDDRSRPEHP